MMTGRVILHLDLDCFYCQVEQKRLGIPREVPAAVQQWDGLIAINYAARALGVTRHMRVLQAMQFCPELKCLHVQTLGGETGQEGLDGPINSGLTHPNDRLLQKACLERYRKASAEIIAVIRQLVPQAVLEKASIDEVYVDVTPLVEKELTEREDAAVSEHAVTDAFAWGSIVEGGPLDTESELDRRLSVGASISCRVRGAIREKLDFTSSVGIAHNKLLAKVGSARNKPDQQTIVTSRGIAGLMEDLPLKKLRNFGGKLGAELQALGATKIGQVAAMPMSQLQQHFGDRASFIADCVRGIDHEPVKVRELSKSMLAYKSFDATSDLVALNRWLGILADELSERMATDAQVNQRVPRLLVLGYRQRGSGAGRSRSIPMPKASLPGPSPAMLQQAAYEMLQKCTDAFPCNNLGLTATEFQELPGDEQGCITRFFQPKLNEHRPDELKADKPTRNAETAGEDKSPGKPQKNMVKQRPRNTINSLFRKANGQPARGSHQGQHPSEELASTTPEAGTGTKAQQSSISGHGQDNGVLYGVIKGTAREGIQGASEEAQEALGPCEGEASPHLGDDPGVREGSKEAEAALSDLHTHSAPVSIQDKLSVGEAGSADGDQQTGRCASDASACHIDDGAQPRGSFGQEPLTNEASASKKIGGAEDPVLALASHLSLSSSEELNSGAQKGSPGQGSRSVGVGVHEGKGTLQPEAPSGKQQAQGDEAFLQSVNMEEQKKIMHEIWVRKNLRESSKGSKKQPRKPQSVQPGIAKQPRLTDMYSKRS